MASKRKVLTLDERIKVIELCKTKSARKVAEELGVIKTQIQSILLWNFINSRLLKCSIVYFYNLLTYIPDTMCMFNKINLY
jgi:hypothetical protein